MMHSKLKDAMGISIANCSTCSNLGSEDSGGDYGFLNSWQTCTKHENLENFESFPFEEEMNCWQPEFWASKFTEMIKNGTDKEIEAATSAFSKTLNLKEI